MMKRMSGVSQKQYFECPHPRVGKKYQAQLPALLSPSDPYCTRWADSAIPESPPAYWSDLEVGLFISALYIFGKDLFLVKEFMGHSKNMNEIQSFYYGRFYNSNAYRRWAERRKSAMDRKPLAESSLETMFSLLHPQVPQEHRKATSDQADEGTFHENENPEKRSASLMEYALLLKRMVGPEALIEGVRDTVRGENHEEAANTVFQVNDDSSASAREKKNMAGVDVDEGEASSSGAMKKRVTEHDDGDSDHVKKQRLTEPESIPIRGEKVDHEVYGEVSESSNGRRRSRRRRVMSTKAVEAFETSFLDLSP